MKKKWGGYAILVGGLHSGPSQSIACTSQGRRYFLSLAKQHARMEIQTSKKIFLGPVEHGKPLQEVKNYYAFHEHPGFTIFPQKLDIFMLQQSMLSDNAAKRILNKMSIG